MITSEMESFLREQTAGIKHSGRMFYEHLKGTHDLLANDGEPDYVCLAGLFHSIYGTSIFRTPAMCLSAREDIRKLIGESAERLAYIFCACNRPLALLEGVSHGIPYQVGDRFNGEKIPLSRRDLRDLLTIEFANLIEQNGLKMLPLVRDALIQVKDGGS